MPVALNEGDTIGIGRDDLGDNLVAQSTKDAPGSRCSQHWSDVADFLKRFGQASESPYIRLYGWKRRRFV